MSVRTHEISDTRAKIAASANAAVYTNDYTQKYIKGAPHIKHKSLRDLFTKLVAEVSEYARKSATVPAVLDLGSGEGSTTLQFLKCGAAVTAVDNSQSQMASLRQKCAPYAEGLTIHFAEADEYLKSALQEKFDIIVASSFLHHVPDYLTMIKRMQTVLKPGGQLFFFQDPLRYDTVGSLSNVFTQVAYVSWRIFQGDVIGGTLRKIRRGRGIYYADCPSDNAEYHVARNGVDQHAIIKQLNLDGFETRIVEYFSTNSRVFQPAGEFFGIKNTFSIIARKKHD